jgi:hypothetical protein
MDDPPRFFVYKLVSDHGAAPCIHQGALSLALCSKKLRRMAKEGDWIFGFGGQRLGGRLVYFAEVNHKVKPIAYYRDESDASGFAFAGRPDRIYAWTGQGLALRPDARFHGGPRQEQLLDDDVGRGPAHLDSVVLFSRNYVHLGSDGPRELRDLPNVQALIEGLRLGQRVADEQALRDELVRLRVRMRDLGSKLDEHPALAERDPPVDEDEEILYELGV